MTRLDPMPNPLKIPQNNSAAMEVQRGRVESCILNGLPEKNSI